MKQYTAEELNKLDKDEIVALLLQAQKQNAFFMEQIATMQSQRFELKTERLECLGQESIFNEAETEAAKETDEPETEEISYTRTKRKPGKLDEMLKGLPTRQENHELTNEELIEILGEKGWKRLPDDVYRKLEYHPATKEVVEHHVAVYAARNEDRIVRAPHPAELLAHSVATPSIVAAVMNAKYTNAMPLYRISQEMERYDVKIPVPTMANWVIRCTERYLYPIWDRLQAEFRKLPVAQADETVCKVSKDGRPANAESRMFVYRSGEFEQNRVVILYDYQKTRKEGRTSCHTTSRRATAPGSSRTAGALWKATRPTRATGAQKAPAISTCPTMTPVSQCWNPTTSISPASWIRRRATSSDTWPSTSMT